MIPLSDLGAASTEWRRDQWGRYLIVPPAGGKPVGYTRVTTVAGTLDSGGGLAPWKSTMTACGLILRRGLRAQWEALIAEHAGDPWYSGERGKAECKRLVEECAAVGGANDRREMGISLHTIIALVDVGRTPIGLSDETEADVSAYVNGLGAAGVCIVPGAVEVTVVLDEHRVAGTFDRLVTVPGFALPLVADLKTGADLSYSWQSIAVQLAAYAHGEAIYRQGPAPDGSADERAAMPAVDQENGLVMWLNAGSGQLELFLVDLVCGWQAFGQSMWVRDWRKAEVASPLGEGGDWRAQLAASVATVEVGGEVMTQAQFDAARHPLTASDPGSVDWRAQLAASLERHPSQGDYTTQLRAWLQERIDAIAVHGVAKTDLVLSWPVGLPTLRSTPTHTPEQLAEIERVLDQVEARHSIPFGASRPTADALGQLLHMFPNTTTTTTEELPP